MEPSSLYFGLDDPKLGTIPMISVGLLIKEDDNCIALAVDRHNLEDDTKPYRQVSTIPKVNVIKIKRWNMNIPTGRIGQ